ncbi:MAG: MFS transporter [Candidatus Bathyarchaeota archaeon]|nr:MFS transporter [Candidatus Bathyarchaeota archaeon]
MKGSDYMQYSGILLGGFTALTILSIMNGGYSYVLDLIKAELKLSYTQSGALMSSYFTGYTLGQLPWGYLADKYGSRRVMTLSTLGVSIATILFGFSGDFATAIATRFLTGLLGAGLFVPSVKLIAQWFKLHERGTALGVLNIGGSVGVILVTWATPLLASGFGWRTALMLQGVIGMASAAIIWYTLRDGAYGNNDVKVSVTVFKQPSFWILSLTQFIRLSSYYTFLAWLPLLLKEDFGLSILLVGTAMSVLNIAGMISNPVGGVLSDHIGEKPVLAVSFLLLAVNVYWFTTGPSGIFLYVATFLLGWLINFTRSPSFTLIPRLFGVEAAGSLTGIHNTFASFGALCLPLLLGFVKDAYGGYAVGWFILSALMIFSSFLIATISDRSV